VVLDQVAAALVDAGLEVDTDLGTSALRCDLAVRRPGDAEYRLAVLLDHRPAEAGVAAPTDDHERYIDRPRALAATGWETTHILAKDWLSDPAVVVERIRRRLEGPSEPDARPAGEPAPAAERTGSGYLIYWTADSVNAARKAGDLGRPLQAIFGGHHISQPPLGRYGIEAGDRIYVVSVRKGALHLLGSMTVDELTDVDTYVRDHLRIEPEDAQAQQGRGGHRFWWAVGGEVAVGRDGPPLDVRRIVPPSDVATITFQPKRGGPRPISHVSGVIEEAGGLTGHYLRLRPESEALFRRVLAAPGAPAPAPPAPAPDLLALPTPGTGRRFHFVGGTSSKFWQISRTGQIVFVTFGRIGTKGQTQVKDLGTDAAAEAHLSKLIGEKTRKGYTEVDP
jgi:predicted DNA-binding WGR domain protein